MGELETNEKLNIDASLTEHTNITSVTTIENDSNDLYKDTTSTDITEYKEVDDPCVALTIIGESRLTDAEIFVRRGIKYSIRAFFSAIVLTIMNLFI